MNPKRTFLGPPNHTLFAKKNNPDRWFVQPFVDASALASHATYYHPNPDGWNAIARLLVRTAAVPRLAAAGLLDRYPHRILDPKAGPLIAVKLHVLTRKSLGGIETDLHARALAPGGGPVPGLYAAGEASGFGGGGVHGYRALEGTLAGGCLFSGRIAGRAAAAAV